MTKRLRKHNEFTSSSRVNLCFTKTPKQKKTEVETKKLILTPRPDVQPTESKTFGMISSCRDGGPHLSSRYDRVTAEMFFNRNFVIYVYSSEKKSKNQKKNERPNWTKYRSRPTVTQPFVSIQRSLFLRQNPTPHF